MGEGSRILRSAREALAIARGEVPEQDLIGNLRGNLEEAARYLTDALEEGDSMALRLALQNVAEALAISLPEMDAEALFHLRDCLARAGLKLVVETVTQKA